MYDVITEQIITQLEHGTVPWRQPWTSRGVPRNPLSLKPYRDINVWLLLSRPYTSPFWCTYKQVQEIGGTVRKGEKGTAVVFWKFADTEQDEERDLRHSRPSTQINLQASQDRVVNDWIERSHIPVPRLEHHTKCVFSLRADRLITMTLVYLHLLPFLCLWHNFRRFSFR